MIFHVKAKIIILLVFLSVSLSSISLAQENCNVLVDSISDAFEKATEVYMSTQIMQGGNEFAYTKMRLFKDDTGEWQSERIEQRGFPRPDDTNNNDDGEEPSFEFSCAEHDLIERSGQWQLNIKEPDEELPIKTWQLSFKKENNQIVPIEIAGDIEARVLFIPFKGRFSTFFSDWQFP